MDDILSFVSRAVTIEIQQILTNVGPQMTGIDCQAAKAKSLTVTCKISGTCKSVSDAVTSI